MARTPQASRRRLLLLLVVAAFLLLGLIPTLVQFYTDWLWFQEIGFTRVFLTELGTRGVLFLAVLLFGFVFLLANLKFAQRGVVPFPLRLQLSPEMPPVNVASTLQRLTVPVAGLIALLFALAAAPSWLMVQRFMHRADFGIADPIFSRDIGYYVFTLPPLSAAVGVLVAYVVIALVMVVPLYLLRGDLIVRRGVRIESSAGMHVGVLLALFFTLIAARIWFVHIPELLYSNTGPLVGASYTDLNARLPALRVLSIAAVAAAILMIVGAVRQRVVLSAVVAGGAFALLAVVGAWIIPAAVQQLIVAPTELTREAPQLAHHITATRAAWGLDRVQVRSLSGDAELSLDDLADHAATVENVRLWDRDPLLQTFGQLQEIRTYYDFGAVDDDRYWIDGRYRQVLLSPRELNTTLLPSRSFINEHLIYTHGMGLTLAPVNQVTPEGLPVLFIKDLPPVGDVDLRVTQPQIYFGEQTDGHVFVNTRQREFDYPAGDRNVFTTYDGRGGIRVGSLPRRSLFASRFGSLRTLLSQDITSDSRVLMYRQVHQRVRRALPFLRFDRDPYIAIAADGTLHWIFDAYTGTARYPYAYRLNDGTSYMRNSAKVFVDAYHGAITAYIADPSDPLIRVYDRIFSGIFQPLDELRDDLKPQLRYPEDLYRIQTQLYAVFHMNEPETFYQREDELQIPVLGRGERQEPFMRRIIMRLPDEKDPEFIFMTQFTPRGRNNLAAWMVARNDGEKLGELIVYRFPRQSLVFGPRQVVDRINQDPEIARQVSLWDQGGSTVIRGELLVIPIEEALIYVQPLYLRAEGGRIPELKRVVVAYENQVVMEETLDEALEVLFGVRPPTSGELLADALSPAGAEAATPPPTVPADEAEMLQRMQEQYERARSEVERLGDLIRQWQQRRRDGGG